MDTHRELPVVLESKPLRITKEFESRRLIEEKIVEALKKENVNTIGICGVGGIGKTRMARRIGEKVKEEKLFKFVVMVWVGPSSDPRRILYEISDYLGVKVMKGNLLATVNELLSRLIMEERILIILDDVWEILNLEKIKIFLQKHNPSCKIMITSRFASVCLEIGVQEIFRVEGLTEGESWILLREKAGYPIDSSDVYPLAKPVAENCSGLPIALSVAGRMLRDIGKHWPRIVANANLSRALPNESQASAFVEREVVDNTMNLSIRSSLVQFLETDINLKRGPASREKTWQRSSVLINHHIKEHNKLHISQNLMPSLSACQRPVFTRDLFSALQLQERLKILDLQDIDSQVTPGSIKNLKHLILLNLSGDGSRNTEDELNLGSFKHLKHLKILHCSTIEYLVKEVNQLVPTNGFLPILESLSLKDLPQFKEISSLGQLPVGLFRELRRLKLRRLPSLLHVCTSPSQNDAFSNLISIRLSQCPKIRSLFSLSMAQNLMQLGKIKIEYCEMMEEIFLEEWCEDGKTSKMIEFPKLIFLELDTLPNLIRFCKNVRIEFPKLREMRIQSMRKLRSFCPFGSDLPFEGIGDNGVQFLFNEKIAFGSLNKLEIVELDSVTSIWCHKPSTNMFSDLEVLVVRSCDNLRNLFSHSTAEAFAQLKHLMIEECSMMKEVTAEDGETGQLGNNVTPFPQLEILELRRLPILESFCHMINGLELPSLEDLIIYDCPGMKEFSHGRVSMPMLKRVKKDYSVYRIDGINYTVQRLLNEKHLFGHQPWFLSNQYQGAKVEEFLGEDVTKEKPNKQKKLPSKQIGLQRLDHLNRWLHAFRKIGTPPMAKFGKDIGTRIALSQGLGHSPPELSCQATGGNRGTNLNYDMNQKGLCSTLKDITMTEDQVNVNSPESSRLVVGEERGEANKGHKEEISHEAESEVSTDMVLPNKEYMEDCILFCSIFPSDYEFAKDMLVWQWIAEGLIKSGEDEIVEEACIQCFDTLLNMDYVVPSGYDHDLDHMKYKFGDKMKEFLRNHMLEASKFRKSLDSKETDVAKVEHLSLAFEKLDCIDFGILKWCSRLQTLMIHRCYGSEVKRLPSDLFVELKALKILNLSHTNIVELPSSIENVKELRYLDVSDTPVGWLPESIRFLTNLQTLNLDSCLSLTELPKCTSKLINLRHLCLDVVRQLQSMPLGIGKLSKLQTLSGFLVGDEDGGSRLVELKDMNKLKGSLRVLYLENVTTKEDAAEARLCNKHGLRKIELQWSDLQDEKNPDEDEIIEYLQPPFGIRELKIIFYSGGMLPSWISNPSFAELVSIILYGCRYCESLPSLGELPSLKRLSIVENNEVIEINSYLCRKKETNQHHHHHRVAFPKLEKLSFSSMSKLKKWTGVENGDFPCLRQLIVEYCPEFVHLPFLSHLSSLLHMEISYCPELSCLPVGGLPTALESLMIKDCPKLKERCWNEQCEDWSKVAHVPGFYIDNKKVLV